MVQFYALSIFLNIFIGLMLSIGGADEKETFFTRIKGLLEEKGSKFSFGLVSVLIGFFKILSPTRGDVPVVGDLLPAVTGIALGSVLLLDFLKNSSDVRSAVVEKFDDIITLNRKYVGMAGVLIGVLHFLMPGVVIL